MKFIEKAIDNYLKAWKECIIFEGRKNRESFWCFQIVNCLVASLLFFNFFYCYFLYPIALLLPQLSMTIKRLHDIGRSGWYTILYFVPIANIWLVILLLKKGDFEDNEYGKSTEAHIKR